MKQNMEKSIWAKLIKGTEPPTRCYVDYEKHLDRLCSTIRKLYDNDDAIAKAEVKFVTCRQGNSESLARYVKRLESIVTELHFMGIRTYEYILKRRLYDGLNSDYLREKVDKELSDPKVSYEKFVSYLSNFERRRLGREQRQKLYDEIVNSRLRSNDKTAKPATSKVHTLGHASFLTMILIFLFILAGIMLFDNMLPQFWEMFKKLVRDNFGIVGKVLLAAE
ncbi:hypothetical protein Pmar_PMAR014111 [Perkinsus marinus ATCC 50983]|uniref:Uncharacterized protein n=1 Tax=Perkinsus marinus (strain ATCC 50983 / TXsc) TaxID=423536 RepID=C5L2X2_PERM5|nr:hypothetical protein Pmar_PMAR014111 [Perkinsus marinus ATCC 50983]EER08945.1 hypothetical protein Pmar_PMAR014111 [Perkinsus marinus ATCC 50983]|eukprot:XP_002777129.1 hypothetical protein Pmar_PMAR014111 [Perkinsus marinus ATCC 50983]